MLELTCRLSFLYSKHASIKAVKLCRTHKIMYTYIYMLEDMREKRREKQKNWEAGNYTISKVVRDCKEALIVN